MLEFRALSNSSWGLCPFSHIFGSAGCNANRTRRSNENFPQQMDDVGEVLHFFRFKRSDWKFLIHLYEIFIVLSSCVIIASSRTSFELPMRLQVGTCGKKAFQIDLKRFQICNRKFWLNGECPSLCLTTFILFYLRTKFACNLSRAFCFSAIAKAFKHIATNSV